jgi:hypothetical protein
MSSALSPTRAQVVIADELVTALQESPGWFGDRVQHGRVRHANSRLHACCYFCRSGADKHASGVPRHVDNALAQSQVDSSWAF